ncbi:hypothetical protein HZA96_05950 [Candidatus Woesearchaeota archaeon]|nr:hypothetical protein [Candidatus Woesearchaeota archaeon]
MIIQKIKKEDFDAWLEMGLLLWPKHSKHELKKEFEDILKSKREETFLCKDDEGKYIGFINLSLILCCNNICCSCTKNRRLNIDENKRAV